MSFKEVQPFISISWNTQIIRQKWENIRKAIYSANYIAEYEMIKKGKRHCDVYSFSPDRFDEQINWAIDNGFVPLTILRSRVYEGYGHRHYPSETIDKDVFIYSVIADTYENAKKFQQASLGNVDHRTIGQLLGYPDCCIDFFLPVWLEKKIQDPMWEIAENTEDMKKISENEIEVTGSPLLNRMARYFGFQVAPFFTHSYTCKEAIKFSESWFEIMADYYPYESDELIKLLSMPLKWSHNNMMIYVEHPLFRGASNGFDWDIPKTIKWTGC